MQSSEVDYRERGEHIKNLLSSYYGTGPALPPTTSAPLPPLPPPTPLAAAARSGPAPPSAAADAPRQAPHPPSDASASAASAAAAATASDRQLAHLLRTAPLGRLLAEHRGLSREIRHLGSDLQQLVYENYGRFIGATDAIRAVKGGVDGLGPGLERARGLLAEAGREARAVDARLARRRGQVEALARAQALVGHLQTLADAPARMARALASSPPPGGAGAGGGLEAAVSIYAEAAPALRRLAPRSPLLAQAAADAEGVAREISARLRAQLAASAAVASGASGPGGRPPSRAHAAAGASPSSSAGGGGASSPSAAELRQQRAADDIERTVLLLRQLGEPDESLLDRYLAGRAARAQRVLQEAAAVADALAAAAAAAGAATGVEGAPLAPAAAAALAAWGFGAAAAAEGAAVGTGGATAAEAAGTATVAAAAAEARGGGSSGSNGAPPPPPPPPPLPTLTEFVRALDARLLGPLQETAANVDATFLCGDRAPARRAPLVSAARRAVNGYAAVVRRAADARAALAARAAVAPCPLFSPAATTATGAAPPAATRGGGGGRLDDYEDGQRFSGGGGGGGGSGGPPESPPPPFGEDWGGSDVASALRVAAAGLGALGAAVPELGAGDRVAELGGQVVRAHLAAAFGALEERARGAMERAVLAVSGEPGRGEATAAAEAGGQEEEEEEDGGGQGAAERARALLLSERRRASSVAAAGLDSLLRSLRRSFEGRGGLAELTLGWHDALLAGVHGHAASLLQNLFVRDAARLAALPLARLSCRPGDPRQQTGMAAAGGSTAAAAGTALGASGGGGAPASSPPHSPGQQQQQQQQQQPLRVPAPAPALLLLAALSAHAAETVAARAAALLAPPAFPPPAPPPPPAPGARPPSPPPARHLSSVFDGAGVSRRLATAAHALLVAYAEERGGEGAALARRPDVFGPAASLTAAAQQQQPPGVSGVPRPCCSRDVARFLALVDGEVRGAIDALGRPAQGGAAAAAAGGGAAVGGGGGAATPSVDARQPLHRAGASGSSADDWAAIESLKLESGVAKLFRQAGGGGGGGGSGGVLGAGVGAGVGGGVGAGAAGTASRGGRAGAPLPLSPSALSVVGGSGPGTEALRFTQASVFGAVAASLLRAAVEGVRASSAPLPRAAVAQAQADAMCLRGACWPRVAGGGAAAGVAQLLDDLVGAAAERCAEAGS